MCRRRANPCRVIIPTGSTAITSPRSAFRCAKDGSLPQRIRTGRNASAWWTKISPGATGRTGGALGQRLAHGNESDEAKLFTIVGVVGAVKQAELTEAAGQGAVYLPYVASAQGGSVFVVARTSQRPEAFAETLRKLVRATQPEIAIDNIRSMETRIADSLIARRSPALLAGIFAGVALLLAAIGTYGVLSYAVAQRTREIGIRMALGAQRGQIGSQFLSLGLRLLAAGTILGLIGAWLAGRAMQSVLFDVPHAARRHSSRHRARHERGVLGCLPHPRAPRHESRSDGCSSRRMKESINQSTP